MKRISWLLIGALFSSMVVWGAQTALYDKYRTRTMTIEGDAITPTGPLELNADLDMQTNDVTDVGLVDGRDVSADGSQLDTNTTDIGNKADRDLGNLTSPTAINQNLLTDGTPRSIGDTAGNAFLDIYSETLSIQDFTDNTDTVLSMYANSGTEAVIETANPGDNLFVQSQNNGAGNSGGFTFSSGTATGSRGDFTIDIDKFFIEDTSLGAASAGYVWELQNAVTGEGAWSPAAATGANTSLSNLTNPTAINQSLLVDTGSAYDLGSATNGFQTLYLQESGKMISFSGTGGTEVAQIADSVQSPSTLYTVSLGFETTSFRSIGFFTPDNDGNTGLIAYETGDSTSSFTGLMHFKTGNSSTANSGNITFETGTASTTRGDIYFIDGSEGTSGECWISTGTGGQGNWDTCPSTGANTSLSNLVAPVQANEDIQLQAQNDLRFADSDSSNYVAFQSPAVVGTNVTWTLPNADGTVGQVLQTNGAGILSWAAAAGGGDAWSDPVDANIVPDTTATRDLGSDTVGFRTLFLANSATNKVIDFETNTGTNVGFFDLNNAVDGISYDLGLRTDFLADNDMLIMALGNFSDLSIITDTADGGVGGNILIRTGNNQSPTSNTTVTTGDVTAGGAGGVSGDTTIATGECRGVAGQCGDVILSAGGHVGTGATFISGDTVVSNDAAGNGQEGYFYVQSPTRYSTQSATLTGDNTNVNYQTASVLLLSSDSVVQADRTFILNQKPEGARLTIIWVGTNAAELIDDSAQGTGGNHRLSADWIPTEDDVLELISDGTDWIEISRSTN